MGGEMKTTKKDKHGKEICVGDRIRIKYVGGCYYDSIVLPLVNGAFYFQKVDNTDKDKYLLCNQKASNIEIVSCKLCTPKTTALRRINQLLIDHITPESSNDLIALRDDIEDILLREETG
jgi:hypothetical protein